MLPQAGDILHITREASVQFFNPMFFRVIRVHDWPTYDGWVWLDGYELNQVGDAVERRSIFVQISGLRRVKPVPDARTRNGSRPAVVKPRNAGTAHRSAVLPAQRQIT